MFITSYSEFKVPLDEVPKNLKGKALHRWFMKHLQGRRRLSCFELSEMACVNMDAYRAFKYLESIGRFKTSVKDIQYPWISIEIAKKEGL